MKNIKVTVLGAWGLATIGETPSFLIQNEDIAILLDMNPGITRQLKRIEFDLTTLNIAFGSHTHADHLLGATYLIFQRSVELRMKNNAENREMVFIGSNEVLDVIRKTIKLHYPDREFDINSRSILFVNENGFYKWKYQNIELTFALNDHTTITTAVRIDFLDRRISICYTSDGLFNERTKVLAKDVDLLIGEAFGTMSDNEKVFRVVKHSLGIHLGVIAKECNVKQLVPFHMHPRYELISEKRKELLSEIRSNYSGIIHWPEEFTTILL